MTIPEEKQHPRTEAREPNKSHEAAVRPKATMPHTEAHKKWGNPKRRREPMESSRTGQEETQHCYTDICRVLTAAMGDDRWNWQNMWSKLGMEIGEDEKKRFTAKDGAKYGLVTQHNGKLV